MGMYCPLIPPRPSWTIYLCTIFLHPYIQIEKGIEVGPLLSFFLKYGRRNMETTEGRRGGGF